MTLHPATEHFRYRSGALQCEGVDLDQLAQRYGTPLYVYSRAAVEQRFAALRHAFGPEASICFAVKSNGNLSMLRLLSELGAGFDLVSGGELRRLQAAGVPTAGAVFAGVAKADWEVREALAADILLFNLESEYEVDMLEALGAEAGRPVRLAVRLNVDVDAGTHDYIATGRKHDKFGLTLDRAAVVVERIAAAPHLELRGYHVHLGSLIRTPGPYLAALERVLEFMDGAAVRREGVRYYDCGGGFGTGYGDPGGLLDVAALGRAMLPLLAARGLTPIVEPGRYLIADAGALVGEVLGAKLSAGRRFALVDAAMNDLIRPALYGATHPIVPLREPPDGAARTPCDVVGPVCESADFLGRQLALPELARGDRLAVLAAGAYGFSMSSNYNSRRRPAEVLVHGAEARLIRRREDFADMWSQEIDR
ncbi:MAG: diaminopimelate decarboxylase [Planctomycetes bacterium]|nr:diaminopimelate decarboxylase [Planctomycetota bacterium]